MSKFDLNSPTDFVRAVAGSGASALQGIQAQLENPQDWDIAEGSYNGILFHVFQSAPGYQAGLDNIQDTTGRRLTKFQFPYQDGQTTDDLGRMGASYTFSVLLHGNNYLNAYIRLKREIDNVEPGELIHPVLGEITAKLEELTVQHRSDSRKSMMLSLTFVEHSFDTPEIALTDDVSVKSALSRAVQAFAEIDAALVNIDATILFVQSVKNSITALVESFKGNYARTLSSMNASFNNTGSEDIPGLLPVNQGGTLNEDGTFASDEFRFASSPNDPFQSAPIDQLRAEEANVFTVQEIENQVNQRREEVNNIINQLEQTNESSLEFRQDILNFKGIAFRLKDILERGRQSSRLRTISYTTPRLMTVREVAYAVGINNNRVDEIELLNKELDSLNFIPKGTELKVPV